MTVNFNNFENEEQKIIQNVYDVAFAELELPENMSLNIVVVDAEQIKALNKEFRQIDKVTDVLSFPMLETLSDLDEEPDAELGDVNIGDIYICRERAKEQAEAYVNRFESFLFYLEYAYDGQPAGTDHSLYLQRVLYLHSPELLPVHSRQPVLLCPGGRFFQLALSVAHHGTHGKARAGHHRSFERHHLLELLYVDRSGYQQC